MSAWSNVFWYAKIWIFWKCIQYITHWDKTQMLKKFPSDKINGTENALLFLLPAPTHRSLTFNLRFLHEKKPKIHLSKIVCGIFYFWFHFIFIHVYIFFQQNAWALWLYSVTNPFGIKIIEKPQIVVLPDLWFLKWNK